MPWGVVSVLFGLHLLTISMIGLRFVTPLSTEAKLVRHTIQLTPRLSEPNLVTDVLVEHNQHVKAGAPLFQFDRRPYEYKAHADEQCAPARRLRDRRRQHQRSGDPGRARSGPFLRTSKPSRA